MIVDFVCRGRKLVIELDGGQHDQHQPAANPRTQRLNQHGYRVIRFWNNEVIYNIEGVLQTIQQALNETKPRALRAAKGAVCATRAWYAQEGMVHPKHPHRFCSHESRCAA